MTRSLLNPAIPSDAHDPSLIAQWRPNGREGSLSQIEGFVAWVERDPACGFSVHYLGRVSPPVPSLAAAQAAAPTFARHVLRDRLSMNHALAADHCHTGERYGWGVPHLAFDMVPGAARAHARQAGRIDALARRDLDEASGHVADFPALREAYQAGYAEAERARCGLCVVPATFVRAHLITFMRGCLIVRADFDSAFYRRDEAGIDDAVEAVCGLALNHPEFRLRFFDDVPEAREIAELTDWIVAARRGWDARQQHRRDVQARLDARLPSPAALLRHAESQATGNGASFEFEGYTLWYAREAGGWSVTNAYGVDHCAFLASEHDFARLIEAVRTGRVIGPLPLVGEADEEAGDHPDDEATSRAQEIARTVARRAGVVVAQPLLST